jgi:hypothetical protein
MGSQFLTLTALYWRKIYSQTKYWPHLFVFLCFVFINFSDTNNIINENILYYSEIICYLVLAQIVMFIIQHCNEEEETKWLIKFRSMPVSYLNDYFSALFGFGLYGVTIILVLWISASGTLAFNKDKTNKDNLNHIVEVSVEKIKTDDYYQIDFSHNFKKHEEIAIKTIFTMNGNRGSQFSTLKTKIYFGKNNSIAKDVIIKAKRITRLGVSRKSIRFQRKVKIAGDTHNIYIDKVYIMEKNKAFSFAYFNALSHIVFQLGLLIMLTLLLGRKFSLEVVLFCLIGIFSFQYLVQAMGVDIIDEFIAKVDNYDHDVKNFQSFWWEKLMMQWASYVAVIEKNIAVNYFNSGFSLMKEGFYVDSPFLFKSIQSYGVIGILILILIPFMVKREV